MAKVGDKVPSATLRMLSRDSDSTIRVASDGDTEVCIHEDRAGKIRSLRIQVPGRKPLGP